MRQESLRRSIGVVPQDTVLFNDTIYNNIKFGIIGKENEIKMSVEEAAKEVVVAQTLMIRQIFTIL